MRRKPVTRSEIRFNGRYLSTLPVDGVHEDDLGYITPIHKLFAPLLRSLNRAGKREREQAIQRRKGTPFANLKTKSWKPVSLPDRYVWPAPRLYACQRCGREFYRLHGSSSPYCSDQCAESSWRESRAIRNAALVKVRSERRAAARAARRCARCNEPITAQRSTGKFCSGRCRVAAHRERKARHRPAW